GTRHVRAFRPRPRTDHGRRDGARLDVPAPRDCDRGGRRVDVRRRSHRNRAPRRLEIGAPALPRVRRCRRLARRAARLTLRASENAGVSAPRDPEELEATALPAVAEISPATTVGAVHLTVSNLDASLAYYREAIGLDVLEAGGGVARLGAGTRELLVLVEQAGARSALGYTGLYHFALLVPERTDLARWLVHAARDRVALAGLSDHFVRQALYASDP